MSNCNLFSKQDTIFEKSYGEWTAKWWQSYLFNDKKRQKQDVFMVPGKIREIESENKIQSRNFQIKQNKPILIPAMNWISVDSSNKTDEQLQQLAKEKMDVVKDISFVLDGEELGAYTQRIQSPFFYLDGKRAISDGYWLFFKQLDGEHKINSFGSCSSGKTQIKIDYNLCTI